MSGVLLGLVIALGSPFTHTAVAAPTPKHPCAPAKALTSVGRYEDARKAYLKLYGSSPVPSCAIKGLRDLSKREYAGASALISSGLRAQALKQIQSARSAAPTVAPPSDVVSFLIAEREFDRVRALDKSGFRRTAREQLSQYLATTPDPAGGIPPDLRALMNEDQLPQRAQRFSAWVERNTDDGKTLLWGLLVAIGLLIVTTELVRRFTKKVSFGQFTGPAKDDDPALSRSFSLELREAVANIGVAHGGVRPDLVLPDEPQNALADLSTAFPQLRFVGGVVALLDRLVPSRGRRVTGHLQPATALGVGASLSLAQTTGAILGQVTLRQGEFGPVNTTAQTADADDYASLLAPATYWLLHEISDDEVLVPHWRAHALFASGARLQEAGDLRHARQLYEQALEYVPPLREVQINLAILDIKDGAGASPMDVLQIVRGIQRLHSLL